MASIVSRMFPQADLDRIAAAVKAAERKTSGEIVPFIVESSDEYEEAEWRCGALCGAVALAAFATVHRLTEVWLPLDVAEAVLAALLAGGVGMLLVKFVPSVKRFFAGRALIERRVAQRAAEAFVAAEVFRTRDRTGILLLISLSEHKVLVVGDSGINAKVKQDEWDDIVRRIVQGIQSRTPADGLIDAIGRCGQLLERRGVAIRADDKDELPDSPRIENR